MSLEKKIRIIFLKKLKVIIKYSIFIPKILSNYLKVLLNNHIIKGLGITE